MTDLHRSFQFGLAAIAIASGFCPLKAAAQPRFDPPGSVRDLSKGNTMFVVPYAHLDTQWRWAYPQVIREFIANTLHKNFDLFEKFPSYVFNFSGSRRYEMMKEYYPADYEKLREYIKAGRWFPCGSSVDENDANVPSGESLIRHVLYGNHYFKREFGVTSQEYMLPDCFGFPYALPSILAHCGIKGFSTQKLTWNSANGIPFKVGTWEGPDGLSIVAALDPGGYGAQVDEDLSQNTSWLARIQNTGNLSGAYVDYHYYGTGDVGGAPNPSSVEWVEKSMQSNGPITVVSSQADEMFRSLTPDQILKLPHYKGELLLVEHSAGSISSQAMMKRWNRKNELLADSAERASVAAVSLGGASYPSDRLYHAWDLVLGSQMHDMLPGTSIPKAYEFCWNDELLAQNQFSAVLTNAIGAITASMDTRAKGVPLAVYNPLSIPREDVAEATVRVPGLSSKAGVVAYDPGGHPVATQVLSRNGSEVRLLFLAKVPATGVAIYDIRATTGRLSNAAMHVSNRSVENGRFKVTLNDSGDIASIFDKASKREILKSPARLEFQTENPKQFPAWNMDWEDQQKPPRAYVTGPAHFRIVESGPVRSALEVMRETEGSKFIQTIRLSGGSADDRIEVLNQIDWQTQMAALKASFPLASGNPVATYDLQLGAIQRGNNTEKHYEVPSHQWIDLTKPDGSYGVGILNDCKYGSDKPNDDTIRLTLIYTPGTRGGFGDQATQDIGRHEILFALAPHAGGWQSAGVPWQAKRLNQPLRTFAVSPHPGKLGNTFSLVNLNSNQVEIQAIKKAEDSSRIIVRLRELTGSAAHNVRLSVWGGVGSWQEVNGQEQPLGPVHNFDAPGVLTTDVPAFSLKTFAITMASAPARPSATESRSVELSYNLDAASTDAHPSDGSFDAAGRTFPAEQLPQEMTVGDVRFTFGPTADGKKNTVVCQGQKVPIPSGYDRLYVLACSSLGDTSAAFKLGNQTVSKQVQSWGGFVGSWDNRLWQGDVGANFTNYGEVGGLVPGFVKTGEVAWFCSHRHNPKAGNEFYEYCYLYNYGFDIPKGSRTLTLPNNPNVRVFAISVAKNSHDSIVAAHPLSDMLADHVQTGRPVVSPDGGSFRDATAVTIRPPLYWRAGGLRYTLDGSTPNASSKVYTGPLIFNDPVTIKVAELEPNGKPGEVTLAKLDIHDTTPPSIVSVSSPKALGLVRVRFSERVTKESAENIAHYRFSSGTPVTTAKLAPDQTSVELTLQKGLPLGQKETVEVDGIQDLSKAGNSTAGVVAEVSEKGAIFASPPLEPKITKAFPVDNLPVKARDPWTLNFFCKIDQQPEDRTIIAGFGRATDGRTGTGRYFTKFPKGLNFWVANRDVMTDVPLDLGKWQMLTATYDGAVMRLYKNGVQIAEEKVELADDQAQVRVMPLDAWEHQRKFMGEVRDLTIWDLDLSAAGVLRLWEAGKGP